MGSSLNLDSFAKIHLPPTFSSIPSFQPAADTRIVPTKISSHMPVHATVYTPGASDLNPNPDEIKQESQTSKEAKDTKNGKESKEHKPRKKRGQYKKTILRQQAEAAAAAAAAGLPIPQFAPLTSTSGSRHPQRTSSSKVAQTSKGKPRTEEQFDATTVESLEVRHHVPYDHASPNTLEMERELAMLAEEAEEDKRRREEEAADRILKRAQVVKHLRSLKSKLATAQIQIGHDLHYQSIDLFSQLYDEVLEDIGRDTNSEMLSLLKNQLQDEIGEESGLEETSTTADHLGHMPTRSSDKPRKRDLVPNMSAPASISLPIPTPTTTLKAAGGAAKVHTPNHAPSQSHVTDVDADSDDSTNVRRIRRIKEGSSQFIGQSWEIAPGRDESTAAADGTPSHRGHLHHNADIIHVKDEEDSDSASPIKLERAASILVKPITQTREEIQLKQRRELEDLQLQQRNDQEEFQRRQLEQLRELQERQNKEIQEYDETKARHYREHLEGLAEKRLKISQSQYSRKSEGGTPRRRHKETYSSASLAYEFDNGVQMVNGKYSSAHSRSPSPAPAQTITYQNASRQAPSSHAAQALLQSQLGHARAGRDVLLPSGNSSTSISRARKANSGISGCINPLPMSTMTLALTAMNQKKRQMQRATRRQQQEDSSDRDEDSSDLGEHQVVNAGRRLLSPPIRSMKRGAPEEALEFKRSPSTVHSPLNEPSTTHVPLHRQHSSAGHRSGSHSGQAHNQQDASHPSSSHPPHPQSYMALRDESSSSPSPNFKAKKRKNPMSPPSRIPQVSSSATGVKPTMGFNKTLLSHFEKWNPDEKTENFFDFVLSDPPDIDVDDADVEDLLSAGKRSNGHGDHEDLNATPTSNAFRWFQEQHKLAQELERQPKIAPLRLEGDGDEQEQGYDEQEEGGGRAGAFHNTTSALPFGDQAQSGSALVAGLIPGEDPLAAFIQSRRKSHDGRKSASHGTSHAITSIGQLQHHDKDGQDHDGDFQDDGSSHQANFDFAPESSPFLASSPATQLLYSEDVGDDWSFQPFTMDPAEEYLNHDSGSEYDKLGF